MEPQAQQTISAPVETPQSQPATPAPELTPEQVFTQGYQKLCSETGLVWKVEPAFKLRDDNTFSVVLNMSIAPLK